MGTTYKQLQQIQEEVGKLSLPGRRLFVQQTRHEDLEPKILEKEPGFTDFSAKKYVEIGCRKLRLFFYLLCGFLELVCSDTIGQMYTLSASHYGLYTCQRCEWM